MGMLTSRHKQTKKSYLANAIVAYAIAAFMIGCIFFADVNAKDFLISAAIVGGMGTYFLIKHRNFENQKKTIYDDLNL